MGITKIAVISIPVSDPDRGKSFYADTLDFNVDTDAPFDQNMRWIQLTPPGGGPSISLVTWNPAMPPGAIKELYLSCEDIDATYAEYKERGVNFTSEVFDTPFGKFAHFSDPDGNGWSLHEGSE